jgi:hypothetical protein
MKNYDSNAFAATASAKILAFVGIDELSIDDEEIGFLVI